ncbi:MAG: restriction endonuclease [Kiritimatiellae bacterium]|jgi:5-methylcytosine-specific restriction enzyme subunit McrC|nr:restriction endonuclease [Kiritimatiellia bacterium]
MTPEVISLTEYQEYARSADAFSEEAALTLVAAFGKQVSVEAPTIFNEKTWRFKSRGWVGYIPLCDEFHFLLAPKVPIGNLFRMLEYAYRLEFRILDGMANSDSIADLYERLAMVLAKRVLDRIRRGLYRSYVPVNDNLPFARGRIDVPQHIRNPVQATLPCQYEEHTADLEENQILLWTLTRILESGMCTARTLPHLRQARRVLQSFASPTPISAQQCVGRLYNRLNQDYEPLHSLCRFFLEHTGPTHQMGDRQMLPILVNMERLFELFVFEWLRVHLPSSFSIIPQENVTFHMGQQVTVRIDITISDYTTGRTCFVLDTKYKAPDQPAMSDVEAIVAYAVAKDCQDAVLIYPAPLANPIDGYFGSDIRVRSAVFDLSGDLDRAGEAFLAILLAR